MLQRTSHISKVAQKMPLLLNLVTLVDSFYCTTLTARNHKICSLTLCLFTKNRAKQKIKKMQCTFRNPCCKHYLLP